MKKKEKEKENQKFPPKKIKQILNKNKANTIEKRTYNNKIKKMQISKTLSIENISNKPKNTARINEVNTKKILNNSMEELDYLNFSEIDIDLYKKNSSFEEDIFNPKYYLKNNREKKEIVQNRYNMIDTSFDTIKSAYIVTGGNNDDYIETKKNILMKTPSTICNYYDKSEISTEQKNKNKNKKNKNNEKENLKKKIAEIEKNLRDAEGKRGVLLLELEKEKAKWDIEKDNLNTKCQELNDKVVSMEKKNESLLRENEKLKNEKNMLKNRGYNNKSSEFKFTPHLGSNIGSRKFDYNLNYNNAMLKALEKNGDENKEDEKEKDVNEKTTTTTKVVLGKNAGTKTTTTTTTTTTRTINEKKEIPKKK